MSGKITSLNANGKKLSISNSDLLTKSKNVVYLDTAEQATQYVGSDGDVIHISDKDRGGVFVYDSTATDDGGVVFGKCVRQHEGAVNVKWFIDASDASDDIGIQKALDKHDYLDINQHYYVSGLTINRDGIHISGIGSLERVDNTYNPIIILDGVDSVTISGITFYGNKVNCTLPNGQGYESSDNIVVTEDNRGDVVFKNSFNSQIKDCTFYDAMTSPVLLYSCVESKILNCMNQANAREGFAITGGYRCIIDSCTSIGDINSLPWSLYSTGRPSYRNDEPKHEHMITNCIAKNSQAAYMTINTNYTTVNGCIISTDSSVVSTGPLIRLGHSGQRADNCIIINNMLHNTAANSNSSDGAAIGLDYSDYSNVSNNTIKDCIVGIRASVEVHSNIRVTDNNISNCNSGIDVRTKESIIANNYTNYCGYGMSLYVEDSIIQGNSDKGSTTSGIRVLNSTGISGKGNTLTLNSVKDNTGDDWEITYHNDQAYISNQYGGTGVGSSVSNIPITADLDDTPDVSMNTSFAFNNSSATSITRFDYASTGSVYTFVAYNSNTTLVDGAGIKLQNSTDVNIPTLGIIVLIYFSGAMYEVSRNF